VLPRAHLWPFCPLALLGYVFACGSATTTAGADAAPPPPAASVSAACSDLYDALVAIAPCDPLGVAPGKRARFQSMCEGRLGAAGVNPQVLEAAEVCARAITTAAPTCASFDTTQCAVPAGARLLRRP